MIHRAVQEANSMFNRQIVRLKKLSPVYPEIYEETDLWGKFWASSLVHWEYCGIIFSRHHVESGKLSETYTKEKVIQRLQNMAELCQEKAIPCKFDDIVRVEYPISREKQKQLQ